MIFTKENNFDIIRLFAALQVVFFHAGIHLNVLTENDLLFKILRHFPGVPIFFTVSGFLVYWSLERNQNKLKEFFKNRLLRIYPALWLCAILTIILLIIFQIIGPKDFINSTFLIWIFGQLSIFQFFTPDMLRTFGVGTPNGSLWTITVELQYYLILPIIFYINSKIQNKINQNFVLLALGVISLGIGNFVTANMDPETTSYKLLFVSLIPYLYNFIIGILIYTNWKQLKKIIVNKALIWLSIYIVYTLIFYYGMNLYEGGYVPNAFGLISNVILSFLIISIAYSKPNISQIVKDYDISYGVYIYHMLVVNSLVELKIESGLSFFLSFVITIILATLSWIYIEKPALKLKSKLHFNKKTI
tara:strand:- start:923 stop:2002 length:1080 start_codon:yes stop_codon:yes gene_type:complete